MPRPFVIFDFDGTVADSFAESLLAYNRVAPKLHLREVDEAEVPELRRMGAGQLMQTLGIPMWKLPRLMIAVRADLHDHFHAVNPVPGMADALHALEDAGYSMAMVTSNSEENVRNFLAKHHIEMFESIIAGASIFGKATRLRRLIRWASADRATTAYVGDTVPDMRAAHDAGVKAVGVAWGFMDTAPLAQEHPEALVSGADELVRELLRLVGGE
jgi:phosphoglycolate phosphatase